MTGGGREGRSRNIEKGVVSESLSGPVSGFIRYKTVHFVMPPSVMFSKIKLFGKVKSMAERVSLTVDVSVYVVFPSKSTVKSSPFVITMLFVLIRTIAPVSGTAFGYMMLVW